MTQNKDQISTHICIYPIVDASSIKDSRSMLWNEGKVHGFSHAFTCITCMNLISSSLYLISSSKISDKDLPKKDIYLHTEKPFSFNVLGLMRLLC